MSERVFITGLGVVSPIGTNLQKYWEGLLFGKNLPVESQYFHSERLKNRQCYHVPDYGRLTASENTLRVGKVSKFAIQAASESLLDANLTTSLDSTITGVSIGTALGELGVIEQARKGDFQLDGLDTFTYCVAANLAQYYKLTGPNISVSTACSSGGYSLSLAVELLQDGLAEVMLVGGVDQVARASMASFNRLDALDSEPCRPFDVERRGTVIGEGASVMVIESESHARQRGCTRYYAEIKGCGWSCDGYHTTVPEHSGRHPELAVLRALAEANVSVDDIDCIIPHGTGTLLNDRMESEMLFRVFDDSIAQILAYSLKSQIGHTAGASAAFSCLTAAMILKSGIVPPTTNLTTVDSDCRLKFHCDMPVQANIRNILLSAYAFGGNNISVILGQADER